MDAKRKAYIESCEVSSVEFTILGGYEQKYAIEGKSKTLPVVLCLHGGPGSPIPFSVGCRGLFPDFTDKLIMVYWDQLGCGINNREIDNSFTVGHFVNMTVDLIRILKKRFPENKLYLFGMSWGSILALRSAVQAPELIDGVLTCGQVLTAPMLSDSAFEAVERSNAPESKKQFAQKLRSRGKDISLKDMTTLSGIIRKYTDGYNNRASKPAPAGEIIKGLLSSPDYRFKDFLATVKNGYMKNESLLREMAAEDLREELAGVTVPYHIFQGETDIVTSTKEVADFTAQCENKNITLTLLPKMGHFPTAEAMGVIFEALCSMGRE